MAALYLKMNFLAQNMLLRLAESFNKTSFI